MDGVKPRKAWLARLEGVDKRSKICIGVMMGCYEMDDG